MEPRSDSEDREPASAPAESRPEFLANRSHKFPAKLRLKSGEDFRRVLDGKAYAADAHLVVNVAANAVGYTRLGITVPKRFGHAPLRNRWKRLVREAFRLQKHRLPTGLDIVVRPRKGATPDFTSIQQSLFKLVQRAAKQP